MGKRTIVALVIILGLIELAVFPATSDAHAVRAQSNAEDPPWGIIDVTDASLTPERFVAALPPTFNGSEVDYLGQDPETFPSSASESETYGYFGSSDEDTVLVIISLIGSGMSVAETIDSIRVPDSEIVQRITSARTRVPYLLANAVDENVYALFWGARDGKWLFTVFAGREANREKFVRALVANLQEADQAAGDNERDRRPEASTDVLADRLVDSEFRPSEMPSDLSVSNTVRGIDPGRNAPPHFGQSLSADEWVNVTFVADGYLSTQASFLGIYLHYAVFSDENDAAAAYKSALSGMGGTYSPFQYGEFETMPEVYDSAMWWTQPFSGPVDAPFFYRNASAGVMARSGEVLVLVEVVACCTGDPTINYDVATQLGDAGLAHLEMVRDGTVTNNHNERFGFMLRRPPLVTEHLID